jgi:methionyl-tRNA formyltransferase
MIEETLSKYIGISPVKISRLLKMKQAKIYEDGEYQTWISQIDTDLLYNTLPHARQAYEKHLPYFAQILQDRYGMVNTSMSAFTLGNWLVAFLKYPVAISELSKKHARIPQQAFLDMLPEMIQMLQEIPAGRAEWQRALALMALPLCAPRD